MDSTAGIAVMIQGDAEPRSCKKRLLSIEHNAADNSYKPIEMDEYSQEINDKIAILRLQLWKSKNYQVPSFISSLSEVEQLAYADLLLKSNQSKYNETPIETITNELTKAYSEMSQLLALTKLCNDKNPGIILKNCLRPSMQQIGVELLPESIIEHKRNYFSTSKTNFTNALNNSRVVASEHRLFFQCTKKLMKYWNIVVLNQAQKSLLQYKAPNKILKIAIDCSHNIVDNSNIRRDALVPLLVSSNGPVLPQSEVDRHLVTLTLSIHKSSNKQRVVHFDTWESVCKRDNELNLNSYYQHENLIKIHNHCERVQHESYCLQLFAFLCNDAVELHDRWVTVSSILPDPHQLVGDNAVLINEVFNEMKLEIVSLTRNNMVLTLSSGYYLSIDLVPIHHISSVANHPDLLLAIRHSFNRTNKFLLQHALAIAQEESSDAPVPHSTKLSKSVLHHYLKLLKVAIDDCYVQSQLQALQGIVASSFGYKLLYNVDLTTASTATKIVYQLRCSDTLKLALHINGTCTEILLDDAFDGIKFTHLHALLDELFKVICHTALLTSITTCIASSDVITVSPINYNRFQLSLIDGSSIGVVLCHGRVRDTQQVVKLYLFSVTNAHRIEQELGKCKCDKLGELLYDARSGWGTTFGNMSQIMNIIVNYL